MNIFLQRLKQRKLVQWTLAYLAAAWVALQALGLAAGSYDWPHIVMQLAFGAAGLGFVVAIVLAWYHGERGAQRVSGAELLILALLLAIGGGFLWRYAQKTPATSVPSFHTKAPTSTTASAPVSASTHATASATTIPAKSIAVLPFENLSPDKNNAYFASGMQDLILTKLAGIGELKVISRTSTDRYASHPTDLKIIAQQLGVATILEGSVQKAGNEVLINVQLVDPRTDAHIWAKSYQRTLDNVFGVEGEVAEKVAAALKAKLSPNETKRLATGLSADPAANDLFLRAEYYANRGNVDFDTASWKAAIPLYRKAIRKDPRFALARARLATTESTLAQFGGGGEDVKQLRTDARAQAEQALALAPDLPTAYVALGYNEYHGKGDYAAALKNFTKALKLHPNDADALEARGYVLRRQGHFDAAIDSFRRALAVDPRNSRVAAQLGFTYMMLSNYPEAERILRRALALDPNNVFAQSRYVSTILYGSGNLARALTAARGNDATLQFQQIRLLTFQHRYHAALAVLDSIPNTTENFPFGNSKQLQKADLYHLMGDTARAQPLYRQVLPEVRAQLAAQTGDDFNLSFAWSLVSDVELGLGHTAAGLTAIGKSQALFERAGHDPLNLAIIPVNAGLYAQAGRADLAVPLLAKALATPGMGAYFSPAMLWLDPVWDPIRNDPRFQALLGKYARYKPPAAATVNSD